MNISDKTRVFIAGCGGMLGKAVYEQFSSHCQVMATDIDTNEEWLTYADVRDYKAMERMVSDFQPDVVINLAAMTDLEQCEKNPENAWNTNALGAENMALISRKLDAAHIYISTAGIFDGKQEYYNDFEHPNPLNVYGKSKYHGEKVIPTMLEKYYIFRAGWMIGGGHVKDKKFINKIFKQIMDNKKEIYVVDDKLGTPTYTVNFAESMFRILETDLYGVYNMVCSGSCSRYDVAKEFISLLGLENEINIKVVGSDHFSREYFAVRPPSEKLLNQKLSGRGINYMRDWKECLEEYSVHYREVLSGSEVYITDG